ncbi:MAG: hypothetical protein AB7P76_11340 [Candidatus Melainabacteria bacterium]
MNYAHWHLMMNHFPILGMVFGVILWVIAMRTNQPLLYRTALGWFIALAVLALPVYFTGQNSHEILHGLPGITDDVIDIHEQWGTYTLIVSLMTGILALIGFIQLKKSEQLSSVLKSLIPFLVIVTAGIAFYTGHLGGQIRHTEIRPGFVPTQETTEDEEHKEQHGKQSHHH